MMDKQALAKLAADAVIKDQRKKQLARVKKRGEQTDMIAEAVCETIKKVPTASNGSLVIYGDPQSGKTEMMICLTAGLLDSGHKTIVHLMNDTSISSCRTLIVLRSPASPQHQETRRISRIPRWLRNITLLCSARKMRRILRS